jgi:hypothetical protein
MWFNIARGNMRYVFRRHLFLLIGLLTLGLFFPVAALGGEIGFAHALAGPVRILIVPIYLVWLLLTMALVAIVGPHGLPGPFAVVWSGFSFFAGLAPYALADYVLDRWRRAATRKTATGDKRWHCN